MIGLELVLKTKVGGTNTFLVDVVNQKLRRIHDGEKALLETKWWPYHEIQGQAKPGETVTIVWNDKKTTKSLPVVSVSFPKLK